MFKRLFPLGQVVMTRGVADLNIDVAPYISEHVQGRWGNVCQEDWQENDLSVKEGYRILSSYQVTEEINIWIVTEADRSCTTVLLPDEY